MKYLAVLGRQPEISAAELTAVGARIERICQVSGGVPASAAMSTTATTAPVASTVTVAELDLAQELDLARLGGTQKIAVLLEKTPLETLLAAPEGKITFGISEFSTVMDPADRPDAAKKHASEQKPAKNGQKPSLSAQRAAKIARATAMKWKRKLAQQGRSGRVVESETGVISCATSLHNGLTGKNPRKFEFIHFDGNWYRVTGVQDIDAYAKRDQNRPARDAKIGMLPPKLAQVLLNLAGALPPHSRILDPFCGTGVVLQEAILLGFRAYGTDIEPRMVEYTRKNLEWLVDKGSGAKSTVREGSGAQIFSGTGAPLATESPRYARGRGRDPSQPAIVPEKTERQGLTSIFQVELGDAREMKWQGEIDAVVTEGYLGKPFSRLPSAMELKTEVQAVKPLILGFLRNLGAQIGVGTPVILCAPAWLRENGDYQRLNLLDEIRELGYNVDNKTREGLIYHREGQIVARDIIILRKK